MPSVGQRFNPHRVFSGVFIPDAVYGHKILSSTAKLLYGRLCKFKGDRGDAYPAATTLAAELGLSERQVFEHLGRLVEEKFIDREPRLGTSTVYHFLWHECFNDPEEVVRKTALPKSQDECGKPHWGSAENRTGGSAENRVRSESVEVSQGNEEENPLPPSEPETETQNQSQPPVPSPPCRPTLDEYLELDGESPDTRRPMKRNWKRPKPERPHGMSDRMRAMRESTHSDAGEGVSRLMPTPRPVTSAPAVPIDPGPSNGPIESFPARWNRLVPEKPVDEGLLAPNPRAYREPVFTIRFDEICGKAKTLIVAGASLEFGFLLSTDRGTDQYRWQQLLAGQLDWMKPKVNGGGKPKATSADVAGWVAEMERDLKAKQAKQEKKA